MLAGGETCGQQHASTTQPTQLSGPATNVHQYKQ